MPGAGGFVARLVLARAPLPAAVGAGQVTEAQIDDMVFRRILWAMFSVGLFDRSYPNPAAVANAWMSAPPPITRRAGRRRAGHGAAEERPRRAAVEPEDKSIAVIGDDAGADAMYGGGGSASVNPTNPVTPLAGITGRAAASGATVSYAQGNTNYRSLAAVPDTEFAPDVGPGAWVDGDVLRRPDRQRDPARLGGRHQPRRDRHARHRHGRGGQHVVGVLHGDHDPVRQRHGRVRAQRGRRRVAVHRRHAGCQLRAGHRLDVHRPGPGHGRAGRGLRARRHRPVHGHVDGRAVRAECRGRPDLGTAGEPALGGGGPGRPHRRCRGRVRQQLLRGRQRPADPGTARRPGPADPGRGPGQPAHDGGAQYQRPGVHAVAEPGRRGVRGLVPRPAVRQLHRRAAVRRRQPVGSPARDVPRPAPARASPTAARC